MKAVVITHNYIRRQGDLTALYLHRLCSGLVERGMEITVCCPHAPGLLREDKIDGVKVKRFSYPFSDGHPIVYTGNMKEEVTGSVIGKAAFLGLVWSMRRAGIDLCRKMNADLIWANWWIPPGWAASGVARKTGLPLVISSHGTDIALLRNSNFIRKLGRRVYRTAGAATVVSEYLKERLTRKIDTIDSDNIHVIPMPSGVEYFPFADAPVNEKTTFLSVARFTEQKRLTDIIAAAAKLKKEGLDFKIQFVGEGPLEEKLKELVVSESLSDRMEFIPLVAPQKLGMYYRGCDAVLLVSKGEGFGLVLVEAAFSGRPAIGARSGGIIDIIEDGRTGILTDLGDIDGLAEAMKKIINDKETRREMGIAAFQRAQEKFSTPILVQKMYNLFEDVIKA